MTEEEHPMRMEVKVSGCPYRDRDALKIFANAQDMFSSLWEINSMIRERLKRCDDVSPAEEKFLEQIREEIEIWKYE